MLPRSSSLPAQMRTSSRSPSLEPSGGSTHTTAVETIDAAVDNAERKRYREQLRDLGFAWEKENAIEDSTNSTERILVNMILRLTRMSTPVYPILHPNATDEGGDINDPPSVQEAGSCCKAVHADNETLRRLLREAETRAHVAEKELLVLHPFLLDAKQHHESKNYPYSHHGAPIHGVHETSGIDDDRLPILPPEYTMDIDAAPHSIDTSLSAHSSTRASYIPLPATMSPTHSNSLDTFEDLISAAQQAFDSESVNTASQPDASRDQIQGRIRKRKARDMDQKTEYSDRGSYSKRQPRERSALDVLLAAALAADDEGERDQYDHAPRSEDQKPDRRKKRAPSVAPLTPAEIDAILEADGDEPSRRRSQRRRTTMPVYNPQSAPSSKLEDDAPPTKSAARGSTKSSIKGSVKPKATRRSRAIGAANPSGTAGGRSALNAASTAGATTTARTNPTDNSTAASSSVVPADILSAPVAIIPKATSSSPILSLASPISLTALPKKLATAPILKPPALKKPPPNPVASSSKSLPASPYLAYMPPTTSVAGVGSSSSIKGSDYYRAALPRIHTSANSNIVQVLPPAPNYYAPFGWKAVPAAMSPAIVTTRITKKPVATSGLPHGKATALKGVLGHSESHVSTSNQPHFSAGASSPSALLVAPEASTSVPKISRIPTISIGQRVAPQGSLNANVPFAAPVNIMTVLGVSNVQTSFRDHTKGDIIPAPIDTYADDGVQPPSGNQDDANTDLDTSSLTGSEKKKRRPTPAAKTVTPSSSATIQTKGGRGRGNGKGRGRVRGAGRGGKAKGLAVTVSLTADISKDPVPEVSEPNLTPSAMDILSDVQSPIAAPILNDGAPHNGATDDVVLDKQEPPMAHHVQPESSQSPSEPSLETIIVEEATESASFTETEAQNTLLPFSLDPMLAEQSEASDPPANLDSLYQTSAKTDTAAAYSKPMAVAPDPAIRPPAQPTIAIASPARQMAIEAS